MEPLTALRDHPKNCNCKAHQFIRENGKKSLPAVINLCPSHYSIWVHCEIPFMTLKEKNNYKDIIDV